MKKPWEGTKNVSGIFAYTLCIETLYPQHSEDFKENEENELL